MALNLGSKAVAALKLGAADVGLHLGPTPITGGGGRLSGDVLPGNWNQWISNRAVEANGSLYGGVVGNPDYGTTDWAFLSVFDWPVKSRANVKALARQRTSTNPGQSAYRTDDHNAPAPLPDPRPGASYPITIFQAEHGGYPVRRWRSSTQSVEDATLVGNISGGGAPINQAYAQFWRNPNNPDQIVGLSREGGSTDANWHFYKSDNNADSFVTKSAFKKNASNTAPTYDLYVMASPSFDGTKLHLTFQNRPQTPPDPTVDQRVLALTYDWATGALSVPGAVTPYVANVWDAGFTGCDVWYDLSLGVGTLPKVIHTPTATGLQKRLFDVVETVAGRTEYLVPEFNTSSLNYQEGTFWHYAWDHASGVVTKSRICAGGSPLNTLDYTNNYLAGGCIVGPYKAVVASWQAGDAPTDGYMALYEGGANGTKWANVGDLARSARKLGRPVSPLRHHMDGAKIAYAATDHLFYIEGNTGQADSGYSNYLEFGTAAKYTQVSKAAYAALDADVVAYLDRWTATPSTARQQIVQRLVAALKANGLWTILDMILPAFLANAQQAALLNLKGSLYSPTLVGAPVFTEGFGWQGNGTSQQLDFGYDMAAPGGQFQLNANMMLLYSRTDGQSANFDMGTTNNGIASRTATDTLATRSSNTGSLAGTGQTSGIGALGYKRNDAAAFKSNRNFTQSAAASTAATSLGTGTLRLLGRGGSLQYSARQIAYAAFGGGMTDAQYLKFVQIMEGARLASDNLN